MKRLLAWMLCLSLILSLAACSGDETTDLSVPNESVVSVPDDSVADDLVTSYEEFVDAFEQQHTVTKTTNADGSVQIEVSATTGQKTATSDKNPSVTDKKTTKSGKKTTTGSKKKTTTG